MTGLGCCNVLRVLVGSKTGTVKTWTHLLSEEMEGLGLGGREESKLKRSGNLTESSLYGLPPRHILPCIPLLRLSFFRAKQGGDPEVVGGKNTGLVRRTHDHSLTF